MNCARRRRERPGAQHRGHVAAASAARARAAPAAALAALWLTAGAAWAQDEDVIATDRPDFVESSNVVGAGRFQIEAGLSFERDRSEGLRTRGFTTPTLLRLGVHDAWELRLESDGRSVLKTQERGAGPDTQRGYADLSLGLKWHMQDEAGWRPSVGWLLHADLDSGSAAFRGEGVRPSLRVVAEWSLPGDYSLGVMPGIGLERTAGERHAAAIFGLVLGKAFTERWRGFVEVAAERIARGKHGGSVVTHDVGTAFLVTRSLQIDAAMQIGANRNTADFGGGVGLSVKF